MNISIPNFRYMADYERFLKELGKDVDDLVRLSTKQQTLLASVKPKMPVLASDVFTMKIGGDGADTRRRLNKLKKTVDSDLTKVVIPKPEALKTQYALTEELYEKYRTLEAVEAQMKVFKGETSKAARDELAALKTKVQTALQKTFKFLNELAAEHVPKSFQKFMDAVSAEIDEHILFDRDASQMFLYVSTTDKGSLVFTYYKMMVDAINEDGTTTPALYATVQWVVGTDKEDPAVYVYLNHEFETPNKLLKSGGGEEVETALQAVKAIAMLLNLEHFSSELGVVPLSLQFLRDPAHISITQFSPRDLISSVAVDGTSIVFQLKKEVQVDLMPEMGKQLFVEVKQLLRNHRNARLRMQINQGKRQITYTVISLAGTTDITVQDADFFKDRFGVNDSQLRRIVQIMNAHPGEGK